MKVYSNRYWHKVLLQFNQEQYEWLMAHQAYLKENGQRWALANIVMNAVWHYIEWHKAKEAK